MPADSANAGRVVSEFGAGAISRYRDTIAGIASAYRQHLALFYAEEQRWPDAPFWKRRHALRLSASSA